MISGPVRCPKCRSPLSIVPVNENFSNIPIEVIFCSKCLNNVGIRKLTSKGFEIFFKKDSH